MNEHATLRARINRVAGYRETKLRRSLRSVLLANDRRCNNCSRGLQGATPSADDYACVVEGRLCQRCIRIVRALE